MHKRKPIAIIAVVIVTIGVVCFFIVKGLDIGMVASKLPTKSTKNKLVLASNGCCFWVEDIKVSLRDNAGSEVEISNNDTLYENDIYKYKIPDFLNGSLELVVEFRVFYGEENSFSMSVMNLGNINDLKETGVLLYFQEVDDMYLNVIAGDYHISYKKGEKEDRWIITDIPNTVCS